MSFTMKLSLKRLSYVVFFLALEAITIAAANCKTSFTSESSVTCSAFWECLKMEDDRELLR